MRVQIVDPSAYTPPYDHALCAALARAGTEVELVTSPFAYGTPPPADGFAQRELFYRHAWGPAGSRLRRATKLIEHVPDMLAYRRHALGAEVVHFQWLSVQPVDHRLLPRRPVVLTAHDLLPREPKPLQTHAQRRLYASVDAVIAHSEFGRRQLVEKLDVAPGKVRVIHHGAFDYLTQIPASELPPELGPTPARLVIMFFGILRPYKGIEVLLDAWRALGDVRDLAELWIVGHPRMPIDRLVAAAAPGVKWVPRFVSDAELAACFRRADVIVLPYLRTERFDFSGVLATALAFAKPAVITDVGGFKEIADAGAAWLVAPGEAEPLAGALRTLGDAPQRERLAAGASAAARGPYSWDTAALQTLAVYRELVGQEPGATD